MEDRNKLFRRANRLLVNEGVSKRDATKLVKEELRQGTQKQHAAGEGGRGDKARPVILLDDLCEGMQYTRL